MLAISSLKEVSKKRKVSKASGGDGGRLVVAYFAFFANFANEGGDFICTGFKSGRYSRFNFLDMLPWDFVSLSLHLEPLNTIRFVAF